jgi:ABC-type nitrate/sulfonate/bicarbonate transport system permease component
MSAVPVAPRLSRSRLSPTGVLVATVPLIALLLFWEFAPPLGIVREQVVPRFSDVVAALPDIVGGDSFGTNMGASGERWAMGLVLAILIGIPLGLAMGRSRILSLLITPILTVTYSFPKAALVLVLVLWFGVGNTALVGIIVVGCLIPIVISSYHGAMAVNPQVLWSARSLGVPRRNLLLKVVMPAAIPEILSGVRIAIVVSLFTLLASELLIRRDGIGAFLFTNLDTGQYTVVYATSLLIAMIGFVLDFLYVRAVRKTLPWLEGEV